MLPTTSHKLTFHVEGQGFNTAGSLVPNQSRLRGDRSRLRLLPHR